MEANNGHPLIDLKEIIRRKNVKLYKRLPKFLITLLEKVIYQKELNSLFTRFGHMEGLDFVDAVQRDLEITVEVNGIDKLSKTEQYIIVSNHPQGANDGVCLIREFSRSTHKSYIVANDLLMNLVRLRPYFIPVNKHGGQSVETKELLENVIKEKNNVIFFPAGLCSRKQKGVVTDLPWKHTFVKIARKNSLKIVPVFFDTENSNLFYRVARIRSFFRIKFRLEMLLLPSELFKQKRRHYVINIGEPIDISPFDDMNVVALSNLIRNEVYKLRKID